MKPKPYAVWIDYGCYEGWKPSWFDTPEEAVKFVESGTTSGNPFVITKTMKLEVSEPNEQS